MRYGIISDIHGNLEALRATLRELAGVEAYLCLGDIVGYGPNPNECVEAVRALPGLSCVVGNHDLAAIGKYSTELFNFYAREAIMWTEEALSEANKLFLASLPTKSTAPGVILTHGSLPDPMEYLVSEAEARGTFEVMSEPLCLVGHTHVAEYYALENYSGRIVHELLPKGGRLEMELGWRYIVNPGGVGQPRDGNPRASYGRYDTQSRLVEIRRVVYPLGVTQRKMREAGLPNMLATRLASGR